MIKVNKKKGITLLEVIITLAILAIILTAIVSYFLTNYKSLDRTHSKVELQSQGEKALSFLTETAISSKKIYNDKLKVVDENNLNNISFKTLKHSNDSNVEQDIEFSLVEPKQLASGKSIYRLKMTKDSKSYYIAENISSINAKLLINGGYVEVNDAFIKDKKFSEKLQKAEGIEFIITLKSKKANSTEDLTKTLTNQVKFRN